MIMTLIIISNYFIGGLIIMGLSKQLYTLKDAHCFSTTVFCLLTALLILYGIVIIGYTLFINFLVFIFKYWNSEESSDPT